MSAVARRRRSLPNKPLQMSLPHNLFHTKTGLLVLFAWIPITGTEGTEIDCPCGMNCTGGVSTGKPGGTFLRGRTDMHVLILILPYSDALRLLICNHNPPHYLN